MSKPPNYVWTFVFIHKLTTSMTSHSEEHTQQVLDRINDISRLSDRLHFLVLVMCDFWNNINYKELQIQTYNYKLFPKVSCSLRTLTDCPIRIELLASRSTLSAIDPMSSAPISSALFKIGTWVGYYSVLSSPRNIDGRMKLRYICSKILWICGIETEVLDTLIDSNAEIPLE